MENFGNKRILSVSEAVRYSGYSRGMIDFWIESGELKCEMPPSRGNGSHRFRRIRREHLDAFLDRYYDQKEDNNSEQSNHIYKNTMTLSPRKKQQRKEQQI